MIFRLFIQLIVKLRRKVPAERRERSYGYRIPDAVWFKKPTAKYNDVY